MGGELVALLLVGGSIPFVAYGVAGVWNHWKATRPVDPKAILHERFARGEIGEDEYMRRLSVLTYGPPLPLLPEHVGFPEQPKNDRLEREDQGDGS